MKKLLFILIAVFFVSWSNDSGSDGSEYNGFYEITSFQEKVACEGDWVNKESEYQYVRLKSGSFFGVSIINWVACPEPTDASCDADDNYLPASLYTKKDGKWVDDGMFWASTSGEFCNLGTQVGILSKTEDLVFLTTTVKEKQVTVDDTECTYELAEEKANELICESMEKYSAQKIK